MCGPGRAYLDAYRFVVTFRREKRSDAGAPPTWRGWVQAVYPVDVKTSAEDRRYFVKLGEVSGLIAEMIKDAGGPHAP